MFNAGRNRMTALAIASQSGRDGIKNALSEREFSMTAFKHYKLRVTITAAAEPRATPTRAAYFMIFGEDVFLLIRVYATSQTWLVARLLAICHIRSSLRKCPVLLF
jgi:hypothetical protein